MRRIIIFGIATFCIILVIITIFAGIPVLKISKWNDIKAQYDSTSAAMGDLTAYNDNNLNNAKKSLENSVNDCKKTKTEYENIAASKSEEEKENAIKTKYYDLEFIWVKLGNYAYNNNIELQVDIYKTEESDTDNDYVLCDLKVTTISSYFSFITFVEQISRDADLKFIPQNLKMYSDWYESVKEENPRKPLYLDDHFNEIEPEDTKPKKLLISEFYKTDVPIAKDSLLKVENPESVQAEKEAAEKAALNNKVNPNANANTTTNTTNTTNSSN